MEKLPELKFGKGPYEYLIWGRETQLTEGQAAEVIRRCEAYDGLVGELRASDNWLHRLLKSCVIFLDDGEVTKRGVEKQSRYNQQALKEQGHG